MTKKWRRVRIEVTAKDIRDGTPGNTCACPVALALHRAGMEWPTVQTNHSVSAGYLIRHSPRVAKFIRAFDRGRPVRPFVAFVEVQ